MKLSFRNACLVFVGCVFCAASLWIPFYSCYSFKVCGDEMNVAFLPLIISIACLVAGITLLMNYGEEEAKT